MSGYKTSKFSSMSMERSIVSGINEKYESTGDHLSTLIAATIQVTTCTGKLLQNDANYELEFKDDVYPGEGTVTVKGLHPFEGECKVQFVIE